MRFLSPFCQNLDAIHVHDLPLGIVGKHLSKKHGLPLVLDLHENYPAALTIWEYSQNRIARVFLNVKRWRNYELKMVQAANRVIVVVDEALNRFQVKKFSLEKFVVVSNALNIKNYPVSDVPKRTNKDEFLFSYVGGLAVHRGLETAIHAMPFILEKIPSAKLLIVGSGRNLKALKQLTKQLNVEKYVQFTGWISFAESVNFIQESDVCIIPHILTEHTNTTIPHKLFQYMYLEKPVIVSTCPPLKRIVKETNSGLVFKAGDAVDFAEKVILLRDPELRKKFGKNGRNAVLMKFNWEKESQKLRQMYHELLP